MGDRENLRSDSVRELLYEMDVNYTENDSDHDSDLDSNVGELFENVVIEEFENPESNTSTSLVEASSNTDEQVDAESVNEEAVCEGDGNENSWQEWSEGNIVLKKFKWLNNSGYKPPTGQNATTPIDYFQLFFTDELLLEIMKETNRYAKEKIQKNTPLRKKSMWWRWKDISLPELKAFLGILINMGMNEKPEIDDYFSTDWVDYSPFYKDVLSKERFQQIFWSLHVSPPPTGPIAGTLSRSGKVRNVVLYIDKKFREFYVPTKKVSVDESTVGFKGKILFKVYNKDKPIKWGIKIFVLSEASTGYICALEPYFGKVTTDRMERQDLGVTTRIVLHLVNKLKETYGDIEGLHVFTDRWYTNLDLAKELYDMKVHLTGTIMRNRKGLPDQVRPKRKDDTNGKHKKETSSKSIMKLKKGEIITYTKENKYSLLLWKDSNEVTMLSTLYDNTTKTVRRIIKKGVTENVKKPTVVCKYNKSMGGVDISDHYISSYAFTRKSLKWWRKVFFWLIETGIVNAFLLYNMNEGQGKVRQRKFRKELIKQLVGNLRNLNKRGRPSQSEEDERLNGKLHLPYPLEAGKTKDCVVCTDRSIGGVRKRSKFFCKTCQNNPGLHIGQCFEKYHSVKKFKPN